MLLYKKENLINHLINMTQKEIEDYNKRCALFLGAEHYLPKVWYYFPKYREHYYFKNRYHPNRFTLKMMKFHSDCLFLMKMPLV